MDAEELTATLRKLVRKGATRPGYTASPYPGLGYFRADEPIEPKESTSDGILLAVITDRQKRLEFGGGRAFVYAPGDYLFVTRETRYTSYVPRATAARPYLSFALAIDPEWIAETLLAMNGADETPVQGEDEDAWVGRWDPALGDAFVRLLRAVEDPLERDVVAPLVEREIVFRLLRSEHAAPLRRAARSDDPRIREAMRIVREDPGASVSVEGLAKKVGMSPSHFAHRFREIARMTPMRFVKNVRLDEARLRMLRDGLRASEVALEVGYASPSHFTRDFKSRYGATPAAYTRELRARL